MDRTISSLCSFAISLFLFALSLHWTEQLHQPSHQHHLHQKDLPPSSSPLTDSRRSAFLHREILKNTSVTCNDGTTAGYYIRSNPLSKRWLVFLEGGWHCYSQLSCHQRWIRARPLMTSAHWPQMRSSECLSF